MRVGDSLSRRRDSRDVAIRKSTQLQTDKASLHSTLKYKMMDIDATFRDLAALVQSAVVMGVREGPSFGPLLHDVLKTVDRLGRVLK